MAIRVLLADDHLIMREGLSSLVNEQADMQVVDTASDGREAVKLADEIMPDIIIMDVAMPHLNGVEATRKIRENSELVRVIALSMHEDREYVARMLEAGASGYLLKDCAFEELIEAIRTVLSGSTYLSPKIAGTVVDDYLRHLPRNEISTSVDLTPREREVLQLLAEGRTTREIANELDVSPKTIETHRRNTMKKVGVDSIAQLTKYAIKEGLTSLED
ncbi:MAG: response regulator [Candidatus Brocadiia bacterium]|nr:response regulator transcription factor [Planctomycetota bacterium]